MEQYELLSLDGTLSTSTSEVLGFVAAARQEVGHKCSEKNDDQINKQKEWGFLVFLKKLGMNGIVQACPICLENFQVGDKAQGVF